MCDDKDFEGIKFSSSIDTFFRTIKLYHAQLNSMADQKANIIIAATSVIITISFGNLVSKNIMWGLVTLSFFSFISQVLAILSVTPVFKRKKITDMDSSFNSLFFGHFTELSLDEYYKNITDMVKDEKKMYKAIIKDIYQQGQVLKLRKYKFLGLSYRFFIIGIVISGTLHAIQIILSIYCKFL